MSGCPSRLDPTVSAQMHPDQPVRSHIWSPRSASTTSTYPLTPMHADLRVFETIWIQIPGQNLDKRPGRPLCVACYPTCAPAKHMSRACSTRPTTLATPVADCWPRSALGRGRKTSSAVKRPISLYLASIEKSPRRNKLIPGPRL
mgnify:FL=1